MTWLPVHFYRVVKFNPNYKIEEMGNIWNEGIQFQPTTAYAHSLLTNEIDKVFFFYFVSRTRGAQHESSKFMQSLH